MRDMIFDYIANRVASPQARFCFAWLIALSLLWAGPGETLAMENGSAEGEAAAPLPFEQYEPATPLAAPPLDIDNYISPPPKVVPRQVNFQPPAPGTPQPITPRFAQPPAAIRGLTTQAERAQSDPCGAVAEKPLSQLGINIAFPDGELPADQGSVCLASMSAAAVRSWPTYHYRWDATCLCHRPLYFEEINLERHGYGCGCCLQPLASAAHFFGTVPALPYCMAAECPHECVYTLGHYRPGSCPPWRCHWPPFDPLAAVAEGGVWTGMILLIP